LVFNKDFEASDDYKINPQNYTADKNLNLEEALHKLKE